MGEGPKVPRRSHGFNSLVVVRLGRWTSRSEDP